MIPVLRIFLKSPLNRRYFGPGVDYLRAIFLALSYTSRTRPGDIGRAIADHGEPVGE